MDEYDTLLGSPDHGESLGKSIFPPFAVQHPMPEGPEPETPAPAPSSEPSIERHKP